MTGGRCGGFRRVCGRRAGQRSPIITRRIERGTILEVIESGRQKCLPLSIRRGGASAAPKRPLSRCRRRAPRARPSAMAQTISDWPRCMSPAVKTASLARHPVRRRARRCRGRSGERPIPTSSPPRSGPVKPMASSTRSVSISNAVSGAGTKRIRPPSTRISPLTARNPRDAPVGVGEKPLGRDRVHAFAAFFVRRRASGRSSATAATGCRPPAYPAVAASARTGPPIARPGGGPCPGSRRRCRRRR